MPDLSVKPWPSSVDEWLDGRKSAPVTQGPPHTEEANVVPGNTLALRSIEKNPYFTNYTFISERIPGQNWNKYYPFQLMMILEVPGPNVSAYSAKYSYDKNSHIFALGGETSFSITLPIPPQAFSVRMPFANELQITVGGRNIIHGHSGTPFRIISMSGTTGFLFDRPAAQQFGGNSILESLLPETFKAARNATQQGRDVVNAITEGTPERHPNLDNQLKSDTDGGLGLGFNTEKLVKTGFYQFQALSRFLEQYAKFKTIKANENLRLAIAIHKEESVYLVEPMGDFEMSRNAAAPMDYNYSLTLKAYRRIDLKTSANAYVVPPIAVREQGVMGRYAAVMEELGQALDSVAAVLRAPGMDVRALERQVLKIGIIAKKAAGVAVAARDMVDFFGSGAGLPGFADEFEKAMASAWATASNADKDKYGGTSRKSASLPGTPATDGTTARDDAEDAKRAMEAGWNPSVDDLPLDPRTRAQVDKQIDETAASSREDIERIRDQLQTQADNYASYIGATDAAYAATYGNNAPGLREPTEDEIRALWYLQTVVDIATILAASVAVDSDVTPTSVEYIAGLSALSDIPFVTPNSCFAAPFPYGHTLETLSLRYLGDANRWQEIAAVNNLRAPFVDETGFTRPLLTNGDGSTVTVADTSNIGLRQTVWVGSSTVKATKRTVKNITQYPGYAIVELDGAANLDAYTVSAQAFLHTYTPYTVNSKKLVFIPSAATPQPDAAPPPTTIEDVDGYLAVGGADILLGGSPVVVKDGVASPLAAGDIVLGTNDAALAVGLTNIIQSANLLLATPRNTLPQHPDYGLGITVGTVGSDINIDGLFRSIDRAFRSDPMFQGVEVGKMSLDGPVLELGLQINIADIDTPINLRLNFDPAKNLR